jgi:flagellar protein FliS
MHVNHARAAATYKQVQVNSRSPLELVVMLYDGALASIERARDAMARRDLVTKGIQMSKALAILVELQSTLNLEEGREVAAHLDRLYTYLSTRILEANLHGQVEPLDEAIRLLSTVRSAWVEVAAREAAVAR